MLMLNDSRREIALQNPNRRFAQYTMNYPYFMAKLFHAKSLLSEIFKVSI